MVLRYLWFLCVIFYGSFLLFYGYIIMLLCNHYVINDCYVELLCHIRLLCCVWLLYCA